MSPSFSAKIVYSFCCLPARRLSNKTLDIKYTGIKQRRYGHEYECASDLAYKACFPFLPLLTDRNKLNSIIFASTSPDVPSPASASYLHQKLALPNDIHCLDVASSCSSFLSALRASCAFLSHESTTLTIASELKHKTIDQNDVRTVPLFSDGAGGVVLQQSKSKDLDLSFFYHKCESHYIDNIMIPVGGSRTPISIENISENKLRFKYPQKMFLVTVENIIEAIKNSLNVIDNNKNVIFFIHQANKNILKEVKKRLSKDIANKIPTLMTDIGNMLSASLPVLRCRVYFLRALFYELKEDIHTHNLLELFHKACEKNPIFKYHLLNDGILFEFQFLCERFFIFDDGVTRIENSWLADCDKEELETLNDIFRTEVKKSSNQFQDILIAAGGGFQTLGVTYNYQIN